MSSSTYWSVSDEIENMYSVLYQQRPYSTIGCTHSVQMYRVTVFCFKQRTSINNYNSFLRSRCLSSPYRDYIKDTKLFVLILQKAILRQLHVNTFVFQFKKNPLVYEYIFFPKFVLHSYSYGKKKLFQEFWTMELTRVLVLVVRLCEIEEHPSLFK